MESVEGSDFALLVTEPTPFGIHDLRGMIEVCRRLDVPCGVVINRSFGDDREVESLCYAEGVPVLLRIPFDRKVAEVYAKGRTLLEAMPELRERLNEVFLEIVGLKR